MHNTRQAHGTAAYATSTSTTWP